MNISIAEVAVHHPIPSEFEKHFPFQLILPIRFPYQNHPNLLPPVSEFSSFHVPVLSFDVRYPIIRPYSDRFDPFQPPVTPIQRTKDGRP